MQSYMVNWIFLLDYDKNSGTINVKFSQQFTKDNLLVDDELTLLDYEIFSFLHRYDFRKLNYFCQTEIDHVFDTLMRFTFKKSKHPLRTTALCQRTQNGLSCIHFNESEIFGLSKPHRISESKKKISEIAISNVNDLSDDRRNIFGNIEKYLAKMIERDIKRA